MPPTTPTVRKPPLRSIVLLLALAPPACGSSPASSDGDAGVTQDAAIPDLVAAPRDDAGPPPGDAGPARALGYVVTFLGGIQAHTLDPAAGRPVAVDGSPFDRGPGFYAGTLDPSVAHLFVVEALGEKLHAYRIGGGGQLTRLAGSPFASPGTPITCAADPKGRFLYVGASSARAVDVLRLDGDQPPARVEGSPFATGDAPGFVAPDPSGRFLYLTLGDATGIRGFTVDDQSGALREIQGSPFGQGDIFRGGLAFSPDGRFVYGGQMVGFAIGEGGALQRLGGPPLADVGLSDPHAQHLAIAPHGRWAFALNTAANTIRAVSLDATTGVPSPVGAPLAIGGSPYSVAVDPDGRFVWVGQDSGQLAVLAVDDASGALTPVAGSPFPVGGLQPQVLLAPLP